MTSNIIAMRVHHLRAATLCPLSAKLVNGSGGLLAAGTLVCHCWLVESNDGLILVDTGIHSAHCPTEFARFKA